MNRAIISIFVISFVASAIGIAYTYDKTSNNFMALRILLAIIFAISAIVIVNSISDESLFTHYIKKATKKPKQKGYSVDTVAVDQFTTPDEKAQEETDDKVVNHIVEVNSKVPQSFSKNGDQDTNDYYNPHHIKKTVQNEMSKRFHNGEGAGIKATLDAREQFVEQINAGQLRKDKYMTPA